MADEINVPANKNKGGKGTGGDENVNQEQGVPKPKDQGVLDQVNTHDGEHELKLTNKGKIVRCSMSCGDIETHYSRELEGDNNPFKEELENIKKMPSGTEDEVKAKLNAAKDLEGRLAPIKQRNDVKALDADGGHSDAYHGSHVTEPQHLNRLKTGTKPDGTPKPLWESIPSKSSQFNSDADHLLAYQEALTQLNLRTGGRNIGDQTWTFELQGVGKSYKLDSTGNALEIPPNVTTHVFAKFVYDGPKGKYVLRTMYPK